jgi:hypothetical protein
MARNCSPITHLLFSDDLLIFAKATSSEASTIRNCFNLYCCWSGQAINSAKSSILFSKNTSPTSIHSITDILPFKITAATTKYLGLPFIIGKKKRKRLFKLFWQGFTGKLMVGVPKPYHKLAELCSLRLLHPLSLPIL